MRISITESEADLLRAGLEGLKESIEETKAVYNQFLGEYGTDPTVMTIHQRCSLRDALEFQDYAKAKLAQIEALEKKL